LSGITAGAVAPGLAALLLVAVLSACTSFDPQAIDIESDGSEILTQEKHDIAVSTKILSDQQALARFGVDIADVGLQAIWLRIDNRSDHSHWLLISALDANYFPAGEAAALFDLRLGEAQEEAVASHFRELAMPL
jgi:hypothetical protein